MSSFSPGAVRTLTAARIAELPIAPASLEDCTAQRARAHESEDRARRAPGEGSGWTAGQDSLSPVDIAEMLCHGAGVSIEYWTFLLLAALVGLIAGWLLPRHLGVLILGGLGVVLVWYLRRREACSPDDCYEDLSELVLILFMLPMWALASVGATIGSLLRRGRVPSAP